MEGAAGEVVGAALLERDVAFDDVDDVDARVQKAVAAGAELMKPIFDVPDVGRLAILTLPGGAGIGWMTPVAA